MSPSGAANLGRMAPDDRRAILLGAVPDVGKVKRYRNRIVIDFSPELWGTSDRYLFTFSGKAFKDEAEAEGVRLRICQDAVHMPLVDAVARYRGQRSKNHQAVDVIARYLEAAATTPSERTGQLVRPRTLAAYRAVLKRGEPFYDGMTFAELCASPTLRRLKGWFRLPVA